MIDVGEGKLLNKASEQEEIKGIYGQENKNGYGGYIEKFSCFHFLHCIWRFLLQETFLDKINLVCDLGIQTPINLNECHHLLGISIHFLKTPIIMLFMIIHEMGEKSVYSILCFWFSPIKMVLNIIFIFLFLLNQINYNFFE